jgi:hypothetical protein
MLEKHHVRAKDDDAELPFFRTLRILHVLVGRDKHVKEANFSRHCSEGELEIGPGLRV